MVDWIFYIPAVALKIIALVRKMLFSPSPLSQPRLKDPVHQNPFLARLGPRNGLLKSPHELFPLGHVWVGGIHFCFFLKCKVVFGFHDHKHPVAGTENFNIQNATVEIMLGDFGPSSAWSMMLFILADGFRIVNKV